MPCLPAALPPIVMVALDELRMAVYGLGDRTSHPKQHKDILSVRNPIAGWGYAHRIPS